MKHLIRSAKKVVMLSVSHYHLDITFV